MLDPSTGEIVTASNLQVAPNLQHLHAYLLQNHYIEELGGYKSEYLSIFSRDVLKRIRSGDASWETMVPAQVAEMIKGGRLYGYQPTAEKC